MIPKMVDERERTAQYSRFSDPEADQIDNSDREDSANEDMDATNNSTAPSDRSRSSSRSKKSAERVSCSPSLHRKSNVGSQSPMEKSRSRSLSKDTTQMRVSRSDSKKRSNSIDHSRSPQRDRSRSSSISKRKTKRYSQSPVQRKRSRSRSPVQKRRSRSPQTSRSKDRKSRRSRSRSRQRQRRSRSQSESREGYRLHIADLDVDTSKRDLEKLFNSFGEVREIWMAKSPPCFAFVVFDRQRDADEALRETHGTVLRHSRIRVTEARPRARGGRSRSGYDPNMRCYQCGQVGHFSRDCTEAKFGYRRPQSPSHTLNNGKSINDFLCHRNVCNGLV